MLLHKYPAHRWYGTGAVGFFISLVLLGVVTGRSQQPGEKSKNGQASNAGAPAQAVPLKPPPLELDDAEPLRLDAVDKTASTGSSKKAAENSSCLVCHANFRRESLAATHATNAVGCSSCHGPSLAHRNDEANVIPPDIMFSAGSIDAACARCHEGHDVEPRAVIERFLERSPKPVDAKSLVCTTCHGEHHLPVRTVRWDRKTSKLVPTSRP